MKLPSYLHLSRHSIYIFRRRIPHKIQSLFNTNEIRISLRTSNYKEAIVNARILGFNADILFYRAKNNMSVDDVDDRFMKMIHQKKKELWLLEKNEAQDAQITQLVMQRNAIARQHQRELSISMTSSTMPLNSNHKLANTAPMLVAVIEMFLTPAETKRRASKQSTIRKHEDALKLFVDIVGDKPINELIQKDAVNFSNEVETHKKVGTKRSVSTINGYMSAVSKFSAWVTGFHPEFEHTQLDFKALKYIKEKAPDEERDMFEVDEIKAIIAHKKFEHYRKTDQSIFWLINIAIYNAMRLEEITQMNPNTDIYLDEAEIWVFDINEKDTKSLKNNTSARVLPIHSKLLEMGLLTYVDKVKTSSNRMFPDTIIRDGRTGKNIGKRANYFINNNVGIKGKTLHSFRHTFATMLKRKLVDESIAAALLGHSIGGISYSRYGKTYSTELLQENLEAAINYD